MLLLRSLHEPNRFHSYTACRGAGRKSASERVGGEERSLVWNDQHARGSDKSTSKEAGTKSSECDALDATGT